VIHLQKTNAVVHPARNGTHTGKIVVQTNLAFSYVFYQAVETQVYILKLIRCSLLSYCSTRSLYDLLSWYENTLTW
jgi:hypothetical protein